MKDHTFTWSGLLRFVLMLVVFLCAFSVLVGKFIPWVSKTFHMTVYDWDALGVKTSLAFAFCLIAGMNTTLKETFPLVARGSLVLAPLLFCVAGISFLTGEMKSLGSLMLIVLSPLFFEVLCRRFNI